MLIAQNLHPPFRLIIFFVAIIICSCKSSNRKIVTDIEKMGLHGKVKLVTETGFQVKSSRDETNNSELKPFETNIIKFNADGFIAETQTIYHDYPDSLDDLNQNRTIYIYEKANRLIKTYNTIDSSREKRFEYDTKGNLIAVQWFSNSARLDDKHEYKYDPDNHLIEEAEFDTSDIPKQKKIYKYNAQGYKSETTFYKRNNENRLVFNSKTVLSTDSVGNIIEVVNFYRNDPSTKNVFSYDRFGNRILIIRYNAQNEIAQRDSFSYQYDSNNNWIKKSDYSAPFDFDFDLSGITERIINYN